MLNRKDLWGGVMLGTALSCVLCVGAMTTSANAFVSGADDAAASRDAGQVNEAAAGGNDGTAARN